MKATILAIILVCTSAVVLSSCNTVRGAGQDVSATGHAISKAAS